jgi:hypothetical protein
MRLIAFITHSADIRQILEHIGTDSQPPHISPARGPPLWEGCDAQVGDGTPIGASGLARRVRLAQNRCRLPEVAAAAGCLKRILGPGFRSNGCRIVDCLAQETA